jgi:hypothetical protein
MRPEHSVREAADVSHKSNRCIIKREAYMGCAGDIDILKKDTDGDQL